jgi:hypothetical protein
MSQLASADNILREIMNFFKGVFSFAGRVKYIDKNEKLC